MGKIRYFFHCIFICYLIVSVIISGMPFEGIIRHLKEGNIVDIMYHAQKNGNVVDTVLKEFVAPKMLHAYANGTTDAMMTYDTLNGTSVPKYRLWNGSSW
jgi:methionine aminopeptidase